MVGAPTPNEPLVVLDCFWSVLINYSDLIIFKLFQLSLVFDMSVVRRYKLGN